MKYELLKVNNIDPSISVTDKGVISSSAKKDSSSFVKVSVVEPAQEAVVHVRVKEPVSISLLPRTQNGSNMLVGSTHEFEVVLRDQYGSVFSSYDGVMIGYHLNVRDVVVIRTDSTHSKLVTPLRYDYSHIFFFFFLLFLFEKLLLLIYTLFYYLFFF